MDKQHKPGDKFAPADDTSFSNGENQQPTAPAATPAAQPTGAVPAEPSAPPKSETSAQQQSQATPEVVAPRLPQPPPRDAAQQAQPVTGLERAKPRRNKGRALLIAVAAVVLLAGASAFAYVGYYLPNQPENVIKAMLANVFETETVKSAGRLTFEEGNDQFTVTSASATDLTDLQNPKALTKLSFDAGATDVLLDLTLHENELYFKLDGLEGLSSLLQNQFGASAEEFAPVTNALDGIFGHWFVINESVVKESADFNELSREEIDELVEAGRDIDFFTIVETLPDEDIRGSSTHHYRLRPNDEGIKTYLDGIVGKTLAGEEITQGTVDDIKNFIDENPTEDGDVFEVWVYKDGKRLAKVAANDEANGTTTNMEFEFFDYDQPVEIEKPENAKSMLELTSLLQEAMQELFGESFQVPPGGQLDESLPSTIVPSTLGEILYR